MANIKPHEQSKAERLKRVYESMSEERLEAIDRKIRAIASNCDDQLQEAADYLAQFAGQEFYNMVVQYYTQDEIEAVLRYHNPGRFEHEVFNDLRAVWVRNLITDRKLAEQQRSKRGRK
jgi:hypothetical protein